MSDISRDDVVSLFGPLDDATIAEIIATGVSLEGIKLARDTIKNDGESGHKRGDRLPAGPSGRVVEIVERVKNAGRHRSVGSILGEGGSSMT